MDTITHAFLENSLAEAEAALAGSDLVRIGALVGMETILAEFRCRGLVRVASGPVEEAEHFVVGFRFANDYLRRVRPLELLTLIAPLEIWHPNMGGPRYPTGICIGTIAPGTPLVDLLHRVFECITWQSYTPVEYDALHPVVCPWARSNAHRFPIDPRPLRWRVDSSSDGARSEAATPVAASLLEAMEVVE